MDYDTVIAGGGAAGLSAALVLGRARRRVLLVDAGRQSNLAAEKIGGLLGYDGRAPAELYARGRDELARYPSVTVHAGVVEDARAENGGFAVTSGETVTARTLLLATGMDYAAPALPGIEPLWGGAVFHCPFCHGWEMRDGALAVYGNDEAAVKQATLLRGWSDDVVLLAGGPATPALGASPVPVDERPVARLDGDGAKLRAVVFADGSELELDGLLVRAPLRQRSDLAERLGVAFTELGTIQADGQGRTSVPGVFAAGDVAAPVQQVALAIAGGAFAAAAIVHDLLLGAPQAVRA